MYMLAPGGVTTYIYIYTYVTLVCGKSVVMRNYNNFSRLL